MRGMICDNSMFKPLPSYHDRLVRAKSPVAWWKRDETSGTTMIEEIAGANLTDTGDVTVGEPPLISRGYSARYDGSTGYSVRTSAVLGARGTNWSMEVVARHASWSGNGVLLAVGHQSGNYIIMAVDAGVGFGDETNGFFPLENYPFVGGTTYHFVGVCRAGKFFLYVNGEEFDIDEIFEGEFVSPSATNEAFTSVGDIIDNAGGTPAGNKFAGQIDYAAIYNTALTAAECLALSRAALSAGVQAAHEIDYRIAGVTPATAKPMLSTIDHVSPAYEWSEDCWAAAIDKSCISVWNSTGVLQRAGVLISPRHFLFVNHSSFYPADGATMRFLTPGNTVVARTLTTSLQVGALDLRVGILDSDAAGISLAPVMRADWRSYLHSSGVGIPVMTTDAEKKALVSEIFKMDDNTPADPYFSTQTTTTADRTAMYEQLVAGDSGCPQFLIIGGRLVLLSVASGSLSGGAVYELIDEINAVMTTLGGGYQLTEVDLTGFGA